jgi:hypothetical protein
MSDGPAQLPDYSACAPYTSAEGLAPDAAAIADFLLAFPHERFVTAAIHPETRKTLAFTFGREAIHANAAAIASANAGGWNFFLRPGGYGDRTFTAHEHPTKPDILTGYGSHIDIDPPKELREVEREAWRAGVAKQLEVDGATLVWFSGRGVWGWRAFGEPVKLGADGIAHEEFEEVNVAWAQARGGDNCHDCSHLTKIAGTIGWPSAKKRGEGYAPALARVVFHRPERLHDWGTLPRAKPKSKAKPRATGSVSIDPAKVKPIGDVAELGPKVPDKVKADILRGPEDPSAWESRSEWLLWIACELIRAGVAPETILSVLMDPRFKVSESVLDKGSGAERYALRQVERAADFVGDDAVSQINREYFAATEGGRVTYYREETDGSVTPMNSEAFGFELATRTVEVTDEKGTSRKVPASEVWRRSTRRRFYPRGFVLDPTFTRDEGRYNLWRGFGIPEEPGEWPLIRAHVFDILANGIEEHADYIIRWTAWKLQKPASVPRVAMVFRGDEGTGKGFFGNGLAGVFGHHGLRVHSMMQVAGRFNSHMRHLCFLFADEATVVDDEQEGALKGIITEPTLPIEGKGKDIIRADNHLAVIMASNKRWVIPAGIGARRFAAFDVSPKRKGDAAYFDALFGEARRGGWAAMLHDLRRMDLGNWHPETNRPTTSALIDQQIRSLKGLERIVADCLLTGEVPCATLRGEGLFLPSIPFCQFVGQQVRGEVPSANDLYELFGRALRFEKDDSSRPRGWVLPTLAESRAAWDRARVALPWPKVDGWSVGIPDYRGEEVSGAF